MQSLYYRDYFSLKTLKRFGVDPDKNLNLNASKSEILSPFGTLDKDERNLLEQKVDVARADLGIEILEKHRETMQLDELDEDVAVIDSAPIHEALTIEEISLSNGK